LLTVAFERKTVKLNPNTQIKNNSDSSANQTVSDFWQWAYSDLMQNTTRGVLAEYIVAVLLGVDKKPRNPWMSFDLKLDDGRTLEVKTMSRLQAWPQKKLTQPKIIIAKKRNWDPETDIMEQTPTLNAEIYVICYFIAEEHFTADPLNLIQWRFYVLTKE
jgi:hypothetical protein